MRILSSVHLSELDGAIEENARLKQRLTLLSSRDERSSFESMSPSWREDVLTPSDTRDPQKPLQSLQRLSRVSFEVTSSK